MHTSWLTLVYCLATVALVTATNNATSSELDEDAPEVTETTEVTKCEMKNFDEYLKCIEKNDTSRNKRQTGYKHFTPDQVDYCNNLRSRCVTNCNGDVLCISECPVCPTLLPVQVGTGQDTLNILAPIYPEPGKPVINRRIIVEGENGTYQQYEAEIDADRKITTIIRLTNIINNTNIIDIPTNVNNTNINHIHIHQNQTGGDYGLGVTEKGSCCFMVRPKSCRRSASGVRCHHKRQKVCGSQCTARTIHAQTRKRCRGGSCNRRTGYVPQPQNQCSYVDYWPYVNCGGAYEQPTCEGCYDHYGYGYEQYHGYSSMQNCQGCYDDGFDSGQMYRRGPVMRPSYHHQPPCWVTGSCYDQVPYYNPGPYDYGYEPPNFVNNYPVVDRPINVFPDDDDDEYSIIPSEKEDDPETDWGVPVQKCKVISDDGTVTIKSCSQADDEDYNPYAAAPNSYPYYEPVNYMQPRNDRRPRPYPRPAYYPAYQPQPQRPMRRRPRPTYPVEETNWDDTPNVDDYDGSFPQDMDDPIENFE